jgi:hypothetical protein
MTTVATGIWAKKARNASRDRRRLSATRPGWCEMATSKIDFAMSTATAVCFSTGSSFSLRQGRLCHIIEAASQGGVHFINAG